MPKPDLRKLLQSVRLDHRFNPRVYALFEGLVEALEPEDTCDECEFYIRFCCSNAPGYWGGWKFTKPDDTACKRFVVSPPEPEDIDATICELRQKCAELQETVDMYVDRPFWDDMHQLVVSKLRKELAEAKVEMAEIERLRPLADLGQLVWGMALGTRLERTADQVIAPRAGFWAYRCVENTWRFVKGAWDDPAEALRSIQKVDDEGA